MKSFTWNRNPPQNENEFEELMWTVDAHLYASGFEPFQRPHVFPNTLRAVFCNIQFVYPDKSLAELPGYEGDILVAKGHRWYRQVYGDRLISDWKIAFAPVRLGNALWRFRIPQVYGQCQYFFDRNLATIGTNGDGSSLQASSPIMSMENVAEINCLTLVDGLTQGMADRLTDEQIADFSQ